MYRYLPCETTYIWSSDIKHNCFKCIHIVVMTTTRSYVLPSQWEKVLELNKTNLTVNKCCLREKQCTAWRSRNSDTGGNTPELSLMWNCDKVWWYLNFIYLKRHNYMQLTYYLYVKMFLVFPLTMVFSQNSIPKVDI